MGDRLRGGKCKGHDTTEQIVLAVYAKALCGLYPDQRVIRYKIQGARVTTHGIVFIPEVAVLDGRET